MVSEESRIFKNEEVLYPEYLPEMLLHREEQVKLLARNLTQVGEGRKPQNTFFFGSPGIGKTAVTKYVFREFEDYSGIKTIYLNCWDFKTSLAILSQIVIELGFPVQRRGWAKDEIFSRLLEALRKTKKGLVICLDEVDQLSDQEALYDLLRINQSVENQVGIVFISNDPFVFSNLEPRIKSSLNLEEIEFKPYSFEELKNILTERARDAFRSFEEGVISLAANQAKERGGDVRMGLEILIKAGRVAENSNKDQVKVEDVRQVLGKIQKIKPKILEEKIGEEEKLILKIVKEDAKIPFGELYQKYFGTSEKPVTERTFQNYLGHLSRLNLLNLKKRKVNGRRIVSKV